MYSFDIAKTWKKIPNDKKARETADYIEKHMIEHLDPYTLFALNHKNERSNLCTVLDQYLYQMPP